jgi:hypothetical protein
MSLFRSYAQKSRRIFLLNAHYCAFITVVTPSPRLGAVFLVCLAIGIAMNPVYAATQGQVGPTSTGTIQITLVKTTTLSVTSASSAQALHIAATAPPNTGQISLCIANDQMGAPSLGILAGKDLHPLMPVGLAKNAKDCPGLVHGFVLPEANGLASTKGAIVTLIVSPN